MIKSRKVIANYNCIPQHSLVPESIRPDVRTTGLALESAGHPIVMACDEAYAMPLATTLRSMVESNRSGRQLEIFVLTSRFSTGKKQKVLHSLPPGSASVRWIPVELASFENFSTQPYISTMTYARLLLPYVFPDSVSKILYIDADLLVLSDLMPLWEIDLEGAVLGAVVDTFSEAHSRRLRLGDRKSLKLEIDGSTGVCDYFNAGVLLVDLQRWRQERISERALQYMVEHPQALLSDQDALNAVCVDGWKTLDVRWNLQDHDLDGYARMRPQQRPSIIHFAGRQKPWNATTLNVNAGFYDAFRSRTEFSRTPREKARDAVQHSWVCIKRFLKQYTFISLIHNYLKRSRTGDHA